MANSKQIRSRFLLGLSQQKRVELIINPVTPTVGVNSATTETIMGTAVPTHSAQHVVGKAAPKI